MNTYISSISARIKSAVRRVVPAPVWSRLVSLRNRGRRRLAAREPVLNTGTRLGEFAVAESAATTSIVNRLPVNFEDAIASALDGRARGGKPSERHGIKAAHELWASAVGVERVRLSFALASYLEVDEVLVPAGLTATQPPDHVHAMSRGVLAGGGSFYHADLVADGLLSAGVDLGNLRRALDFGCSSGRVVRVLKAAYPRVEWCGCDPNEEAIAWATGAIEGVEFRRSPQTPPLEWPDGHFDAIYAISIWSHFGRRLGLEWFDEMHRLLGPGGHLVATTHGRQSVAYYAETGERSVSNLVDIQSALDREGFWYAAEFGDQGDYGVVNEEWGTAFFDADWLASELCPRWQIAEFVPGRNERNQDVYVLRRP